MTRLAVAVRTSCAVMAILWDAPLVAQTTAGTSATIVVPVIAQTATFASEVTAYNPNPGAITVAVAFYDANNTASPGPKTCLPLSLPAGQSVQFSAASQCTLPAGSNFGLLVLSEESGTQRFYGFARTETPSGVGFATEGFPIENFNDQLQHATGLKRTSAAPIVQTNCFAASLADAVSYELRLFDGTTNAQICTALAGALAAYQQYRYLDVFAQVGAPAGDYTNVRAEFTNLTAANKKLIGFCTVQENQTFSADFRIAKSFGGTPQNAFVQGGNAFGTTALLGTVDNQPLTVLVNNQPALRLDPVTDADSTSTVNVIIGSPLNTVDAGVVGATIAGGGGYIFGAPSPNQVTQSYATIGGGVSNLASGNTATIAGGWGNTASAHGAAVGGGVSNDARASYATVGGGFTNWAGGDLATVSGGLQNTAGGILATVVGGNANSANGYNSFAAGFFAHADETLCAVFGLWSTEVPMSCLHASNIFRIGADHGFSVDYSAQRFDGGGTRWVTIGDLAGGQTIATWTGAFLTDGGAWTNASDRNQKEQFTAVDRKALLANVLALPITEWRYKAEPQQRHLGPVAQDFYAAFGLGTDDRHIATIDEGGVALAAIQGLHQLVQEKDARIAALEQRVAELESLRGELAALRSALIAMQQEHGHIAAK